MKTEERMQELVSAQALEWLVAHRAGELSEAQREAFIDWLRASPAHVREYLALTGFGEDLKTVTRSFAGSTDALIEQAMRADSAIVEAIPIAASVTSRQTAAWKPEGHSRRRIWKLAASFAIACVALAVFSVWVLFEPSTYATAHAEQRSWRMPDGSIVHLNSATKIKVRFDDQRREVDLLEGQALFQVAKDAHRPFWVRAGDATVKAVGTEFDVYRQTEGTVISVVEGRVAVWGSSPPINETAAPVEPLTQLDAGQQARIDHKSANISRHIDDVRKTVAWLQRQVIFDHDSLSTAAEEFNRYSETQIRIDDRTLQALEISGIFSAYDTEAFIRFLEHQPEMQVMRGQKEIVVTPAISK